METMIVVLWVVVFACLVLSPFRRTPILFAVTMGVWLTSVILTAIATRPREAWTRPRPC